MACRAVGLVMALVLFTGCSRSANPVTGDVLFFVHGAAGDGSAYDGLIRGLQSGGADSPVQRFQWGAAGPFFLLNFQDAAIHRRAEERLANALDNHAANNPGARIDLLGHSAGCGVILGALHRVKTARAHAVILLNPSVSPGYDLHAPLGRIDGRLHVFHSEKDTVFLSWRTGTFGTYDNVKTKAAGNTGFTGIERLPPELREKLVQHPHIPAYETQHNDGGHFGTTHEPFARQTLAPLLKNAFLPSSPTPLQH